MVGNEVNTVDVLLSTSFMAPIWKIVTSLLHISEKNTKLYLN